MMWLNREIDHVGSWRCSIGEMAWLIREMARLTGRMLYSVLGSWRGSIGEMSWLIEEMAWLIEEMARLTGEMAWLIGEMEWLIDGPQMSRQSTVIIVAL